MMSRGYHQPAVINNIQLRAAHQLIEPAIRDFFRGALRGAFRYLNVLTAGLKAESLPREVTR